MTCGHGPLVTVDRMKTVTLVPQQASTAVGVSNVQGALGSTVLFVAHINTGGFVSTTVTAWLQGLVLPQQSITFQVPRDDFWAKTVRRCRA